MDPRRGTTIRLLDSFLRASLGGGSNDYYGTFPADKIPQHLLRVERFQIVINTSSTRDPPGSGGHFITVEATRKHIVYLDPLGAPCSQPDIANFIRDCQRSHSYFNDPPIPHKSSVFCSLFCALFVLYHHLKPNWRLEFSPSPDLKSNDQKCITYINRLLGDPRLTPRLTRF